MALDLEHIRGVVERVAAASGLELVEVEFRGSGRSRMLRVVIDRPGASVIGQPGGVTHEDCARISHEVSTILDVEDAVPGASYLLEVSSPGLDRKLAKPADYERFTGSRIKVRTRDPVRLPSGSENRFFEGRLESFADGRLFLELSAKKKKGKPGKGEPFSESGEPTHVEIELANVEKANLVPEI